MSRKPDLTGKHYREEDLTGIMQTKADIRSRRNAIILNVGCIILGVVAVIGLSFVEKPLSAITLIFVVAYVIFILSVANILLQLVWLGRSLRKMRYYNDRMITRDDMM